MARLDFSGLTCVIPTHNRVPFLRRQLEYIAGAGEFPQVMIVDSSEQEQANANRQLVLECAHRKIDYRHDPAPFFEKLTRGLSRVSTPFVVICADDDTLAPQGLAACLQELRADPQCASAIGRCYILNTGAETLSIARGYSLTQADPVKRLRYYLDNWFSNYYAIHRRERLIEQLRLGQMVVDPLRSRLLNEVLDSMLAVCGGPLRFVDVDYLTYQIHDDNLSKNSVAIADPNECDHLVRSVSIAVSSYLGRRSGLSPGEEASKPYEFPEEVDDDQVRALLAADMVALPVGVAGKIDRLLHAYMRTQKIPGRDRSRRRRLARETQKLRRRILGVRSRIGFLEKQDLSYAGTQFRDANLRRGFCLSVAHPAGMRLASGVGLGKTA